MALNPIRAMLTLTIRHVTSYTEFTFEIRREPGIGVIGEVGYPDMPEWPKEKLLKHGPELPREERIRRYQENIRTIRASGCAVPISAMVDSLDPAVIELWFADNAFSIDRIRKLSAKIAELPEETEFPSPFMPIPKGD